MNNNFNILNNNLLKKKKSSIHKNEKKSFILGKKFLKINLINNMSVINNKLVIKFSFFKKKLKLKKIKPNGKLLDNK